MNELKLAMPRNQGWGGFLTKVAKSTQLKTKDVRDVIELKAADVNGVLAAAHAIAIAERKEGRGVIMPRWTTVKPPPPAAFGVAMNDVGATLTDETL